MIQLGHHPSGRDHVRQLGPHMAPALSTSTAPFWSRLLAGLLAASGEGAWRVRSRFGNAAIAGRDGHGRKCRDHLG